MERLRPRELLEGAELVDRARACAGQAVEEPAEPFQPAVAAAAAAGAAAMAFDPDDLDTPAYLRRGKLLN